jgi:hypothetical protein
MTHSTQRQIRNTKGKLFTIRRSTDGCDDTFDIVCRLTGDCIASFGFWDEAVLARRNAQKFARALDAFYKSGGYFCQSGLFKAIETLGREFPYWEVLSV